MNNLLIADDEKIVIESLTFIIQKSFPNEFFILSARSGREAILLAEQNRIDIAFVDISMPGINGLQTIQRLKETYSDIVFIILTAFDKFDYAKDALHLGVMDYLLKPIRREKIMEVLSEARQRAENKKKTRRMELDISERLEKANSMLEKELVSSVISPRILPELLEEHMRILGISDLSGYCMLLEFDDRFVERNGIVDGQGDSVGSEYTSVCEQIRTVGRYLIGSFVINRLIIIRISDDACGQAAILQEAEQIRRRLAEHVDAQVRIGIGSYTHAAQEIPGSYYAAVLALRFAEPNQPIVDYLQVKDRQAQDSKEGAGVGKPIQQAIAYIHRHYNRNLSLDLMAEIVNMSASYFSRLFKEETGCNFIDYVTRIRIDRAKALLLENNLSVKEISIAVGYRDSGYFSRIFKKMTGILPSDYT